MNLQHSLITSDRFELRVGIEIEGKIYRAKTENVNSSDPKRDQFLRILKPSRRVPERCCPFRSLQKYIELTGDARAASAHPGILLFTRDCSKRPQDSTVNKYKVDTFSDAGFDIKGHDTRRLSITYLLQLGFSIAEIKEWLNYRSSEMITEVYNQLTLIEARGKNPSDGLLSVVPEASPSPVSSPTSPVL